MDLDFLLKVAVVLGIVLVAAGRIGALLYQKRRLKP